jgi:hypothetical protein
LDFLLPADARALKTAPELWLNSQIAVDLGHALGASEFVAVLRTTGDGRVDRRPLIGHCRSFEL